MNPQRIVLPASVAAPARRVPAAAREPAVATPALPDRPPPPACEYVDIGRGNGFLLSRAGDRPTLNVIGEIG